MLLGFVTRNVFSFIRNLGLWTWPLYIPISTVSLKNETYTQSVVISLIAKYSNSRFSSYFPLACSAVNLLSVRNHKAYHTANEDNEQERGVVFDSRCINAAWSCSTIITEYRRNAVRLNGFSSIIICWWHESFRGGYGQRKRADRAGFHVCIGP